jgi:hypothetical protein
MYTRLSTVTVPATNRRLARLDLLKMGPTIKDGSQDEYLDYLRDVASQTFESACNRTFARETIRDVFRIERHRFEHNINQNHELVLSRRPIVSVASVVDWTGTVDPTLYEFDADAGVLYHLWNCGDGTFARIPWRSRTVTVTYVAGYILPDDSGANLPADIQDAVLTLIRMRFKGKDRDPSLRSQSDGGIGNQSFWLGMPPDVQATINKYADIPVGA